MANELKRVFRDRLLTPEEAARDEAVRREIESEFPPVTRDVSLGPLSEALKNALRASGRSLDEIAQQVGLSTTTISRFLNGERDISLSAADKLADIFGLKIAAES